MNNFILATATLIGTIIGVGMFGIPYAAYRAGLVPTVFYLLLTAGVMVLIHLIYGEVVLRTKARHRLAGYAEFYLGQKGKLVASVAYFTNMFLALFAYLLVGGIFLSVVFSGYLDFSYRTGSIALAVLGFAVVFKGLKLTGFFELVMSAILLSLILGLLSYGINFVSQDNLILWNSKADLFLPYGVMLFALAGGSAIPEIRNFFGSGEGRRLKKAIIWGTLIPAAVYLVFMVLVLGISGVSTTEDAILGLTPFLGGIFSRYGALVGLLAVMTSFFTIGLSVKNSFVSDFKLPKVLSFVLTVIFPIVLLFLSGNGFVRILSLSGGVLVGLEGILIVAIWSKSRQRGDRAPEYSVSLKKSYKYILVLAFLIGIVYEIIYTFKF